MENLHSRNWLLLLQAAQAAPIYFFRPNGAPVKNDYRQHAAALKDFTQGWPGIYYIKMLGQLLGRSFFSRFQTDKNTTHTKKALEKPWNQP